MEIEKYKEWVRALCLLSFAGSGIKVLGYGFAALFPTIVTDWVQQWALGGILNSVSLFYFPLLAIVAFVSFYGVIKMWQSKIQGYFIYSAAQILLYILPLVFLGEKSFNILNTIATVLFVASYGWLFYRMNKMK
ncbi:hypothetical protein EMN47_03170 [Prolixibacteraceae bacterium JC049]|nr:hypothetical protein [Prolixibacteraceae bacterium JC049]